MKTNSVIVIGQQRFEDFANPSNNAVYPVEDYRTNFIVEADGVGDRKIANTNIWSKLVVVSRRGHYTIVGADGNLRYRTSGLFQQPIQSLWGGDDGTAYNKALSRFYEKLQSSNNLAVDVAEFRQTRQMVGRVIPKLTSGADIAIAFARKPTKALANAYLQWQYGWRPLAQSLYGALDQCYKRRSFKIRATAYVNVHGKKSLTSAIDSDMKDEYVWYGSQRYLFEALYWSPDLLADINGFTSLNPIAIGWELFPYSFVLDWAWNLGGYLQNMENAIATNSQFRQGYRTYSSRVVTQVTCSDSVPFAGQQYVQDISGMRVDTRKERFRLSGSPVPALPRVRLEMGGSRLLSAVALLRQKFK